MATTHATQKSPRFERLASVLRTYREGAGLTQTDIERVSGGAVKREYVSGVELGRIGLIYPEPFGQLRRILRFPGWEVLEAMGYATDLKQQGIDDSLLQLLRRLTLPQQKAVAAFVRATIAFDDKLNPDHDSDDSTTG
jgi:transcriptional regulator with XRE-family HTH domain